MPLSKQDRIIGSHGKLNSALKDWLLCEDVPATTVQCIRRLDENPVHREAILNECAEWIVIRHVSKGKLKLLDEKRKTLSPEAFKKYVNGLGYLPKIDTTRKGNLGEILLAKYLEEITGYTSFGIYRLAYSTNVDQSMKGDDVLLFNPNNIAHEAICGECKVRKRPDKEAIEDIVNNLQGNNRFPTSVTFYSTILDLLGRNEIVEALDELQVNISLGQVSMRKVGFFLSKRNAVFAKVKKKLKAKDPDFAFIALGIDNVQQFVDDAYEKANNLLLNGFE